MSRKPKITKVIVTAELHIEDSFIYDRETLAEDFLNEAIKVKSGLYENLAMGWVTDVKVVPQNTEGRPRERNP